MPSSSQPAVTPSGIRAGDPAALAALVERRANAVLAYCEAIFPPGLAVRAAAEAFARFRAAVAATEDPRALDPEVLLLGATRHAAAALREPAAPPAAGGLRGRLGGGRRAGEICARVPALLAARAEGTLTPTELDGLSAHLAAHPECEQLAAAVDRAEAAFTQPPARTVPIGALTEIMLALAGAAPITATPEAELTFGVVPESEEGPALDGPPAADSSPPAAVERDAAPDSGAGPDAPGAPRADVAPAAPVAPVPRQASLADEGPGPGTAAPQEARAAAPTGPRAGADTVGPPAPAATADGSVTAPPGPGGVALPRPDRRGSSGPGAGPGVVLRFVLPALCAGAALLAALGVAGFFSSESAAPVGRAPVTTTAIPAAPPADAPPVPARTAGAGTGTTAPADVP